MNLKFYTEAGQFIAGGIRRCLGKNQKVVRTLAQQKNINLATRQSINRAAKSGNYLGLWSNIQRRPVVHYGQGVVGPGSENVLSRAFEVQAGGDPSQRVVLEVLERNTKVVNR